MPKLIKSPSLIKNTQFFLDSIADGVFVVNTKGLILETNRAAIEILGYSEKELLGQPVLKMIGAVDDKGRPINKNNAAMFGSILHGKIIKNAIRQFSKKDGQKFWVSISTNSIAGLLKKSKGGVIIFRDINEQKIKDDYWSDFAHIASHNLRAPLGNVLWAVESMLSGQIGEFTVEQKGYIEDMYRTLKDMNRLVNDLLGVSRLNNKKMKPKLAKVSIEQTIKNVIKDVEYYANAQNVKLKLVSDKNHFIKADENHLRTIIQNLVENAIRYSFPGKEIELAVSAKDKEVRFSCKNEGIGIPKDKQKFIFSKFFRAKNAVEKIGGGTGLGLYITHEMVKLNKGKIWFTSELNKTTAFYATFKSF